MDVMANTSNQHQNYNHHHQHHHHHYDHNHNHHREQQQQQLQQKRQKELTMLAATITPQHYKNNNNNNSNNNSTATGNGCGDNGDSGGSGNDSSPYQREVREWQRIDPDTGALLTGRLEADRWVNGPSHSYGKISDSQNISQPNGIQHSQHKQVEVLQACTARGAMQVIRAQTIQTTSSRWSTSSTASPLLRLSATTCTTTCTSTSTSTSSPITTPQLPLRAPAPAQQSAIKQNTHNKLEHNKNDNNISMKKSVTREQKFSNNNNNFRTTLSLNQATTTETTVTTINTSSVSSSSSSLSSTVSVSSLSGSSCRTSPTALVTNTCNNRYIYDEPEAKVVVVVAAQAPAQTPAYKTKLLLLGKHKHKQLQQLQLDNDKMSTSRPQLEHQHQHHLHGHYAQKHNDNGDDDDGNGDDGGYDNDDDMAHNGHANDTLTVDNPYLVNNLKIGNESIQQQQQQQQQNPEKHSSNQFNTQFYHNEVVDNCGNANSSCMGLMTKHHSIALHGQQQQHQQQECALGRGSHNDSPSHTNSSDSSNSKSSSSSSSSSCNSSRRGRRRNNGNNVSIPQSSYSHSHHHDGNQFLLDAAPSLKLSNLMKTSSNLTNCGSGSGSGGSTGINTATASSMPIKTMMPSTLMSMNTHKSGLNQKISLHAIVGNINNNNNNNNNNNITTDMNSKSSMKAAWHQQSQQRQPTLFTSSNNNNNKNNSTKSSYHNTSNYNSKSSTAQSQSRSYSTSHTSSNQTHLMEKTCVGVNINCNAHDNDDNGAADDDDDDDDDNDDEEYHLTKNTTTTTTAPTTVSVTLHDLQRYHHQQHEPQQQKHDESHQLEIDRLTPTRHHHSSIHHNRDLENFRLYNNDPNQTVNDEKTRFNKLRDNNNDFRLSSRYLKRQQIPYSTSGNAELLASIKMTSPLQRSHSVSTDDLSSEYNPCASEGIEDDDENPKIWRRVSKLRRSFQSSNKPTNEDYKSIIVARKPLDLPHNSVSVAKIRAELESGRRLHNNLLNVKTLNDSINVSDTKEAKSSINRKDSFLTAESLKEIRGKLKKVPDAALYKDDSINKLQQEEVKKITYNVDNIDERFRLFNPKKDESSTIITVTGKHASHSLESRLKYREANSTEWHLRRKSYGFEKMSPPEKKVMPGLDNSTDSGLGRSSELSNWSPTLETPTLTTTTNRNSTVIHFGNTHTNPNTSGTIQRLYTKIKEQPEEDAKRHSIALDERQYSTENLRQSTQIRLNGLSCEPYVESSSTPSSTALIIPKGSSKRVEFCKTEVHFATESGRVNIVETDSKPPPTNNFRRRRRSSSMGPLQRLVHAASTVSTSPTPLTSTVECKGLTNAPVTLFSDTTCKTRVTSPTLAYRDSRLESPELQLSKDSTINVTISIPPHNHFTSTNYPTTSVLDNIECDTDDLINLRGILKNKPAKPKPYVLGENIESAQDLWKQKQPLQIKNNRDSKSFSPSPTLITTKTVAERVRLVEQQQQQQPLDLINNFTHESNISHSFSTKINVSLGDSSKASLNRNDPGKEGTNQTAQELLLQDLKAHQRLLDEGLKSTTLIIRTLRSSNEFDEAMKRLSLANNKVNYTTSIIIPTPSHTLPHTCTPSLDLITEENALKYNTNNTKYTSSGQWPSVFTSNYIRDSSNSDGDVDSVNIMSVSQQLQRLRMIFDAGLTQSEDSADEEVKSYFKEDNNESSDNSSEEGNHREYKSSWSRLKVERALWKINNGNAAVHSKKASDLPKSNVMSIKLHSASTRQDTPDSGNNASTLAKSSQSSVIVEEPSSSLKTKATSADSNLLRRDSLKIIKEARGARQLRNHELSYFGVPIDKTPDQSNIIKTYQKTPNVPTSSKRSLPSRRIKDELTDFKKNEEKEWLHDLLKHPTLMTEKPKAKERVSLLKQNVLDSEDEHLYENIANEITSVFKVKSPSPPSLNYNRKLDVDQDVKILNEMNRNADQTLKELSEDSALKERRRHSLPRHKSKPLETIAEKAPYIEKLPEIGKAVKVTKGTHASEAKRTVKRGTPPLATNSRERTSSQSSIECCPRARSRSLSSEKEYESLKARNTRVVNKKSLINRSNSCESRNSTHSQYSSTEDQHCIDNFRREERSRIKTKRHSNSINMPTSKTTSTRSNHHSRDDMKRSSTKHSSTNRERFECPREQSYHKPTKSTLQRTAGSMRRQKYDSTDYSQRLKSSDQMTVQRVHDERYEKSTKNDEQRTKLGVHRSGERQVEREKGTSKAKVHSNRSTSQQRHRDLPGKASTPERQTKLNKHLTNDNATSSKNIAVENSLRKHNYHDQQPPYNQSYHHYNCQQPPSGSTSKRNLNDKPLSSAEHMYDLKTAFIRRTAKRDKSHSKRERKS